jgi:hypothetical protein
MFVLEEPLDLQSRQLVVRLEHTSKLPQRTLGSFRLSATADPPPLPSSDTAE